MTYSILSTPAAIAFVNNDISDIVLDRLVKQLRIDIVITEKDLCEILFEDPEWADNVTKIDGERVLVLSDYSNKCSNSMRDIADIILYVSHSLVQVACPGSLVPKQSFHLNKIHWGQLGVFVNKNKCYSSIHNVEINHGPEKNVWLEKIVLSDGLAGESKGIISGADCDGNVHLMWLQSNSSNGFYNIYWKRYNYGLQQWDTKQKINCDSEDSSMLSFSVAGNGEVIAIWVQENKSGEKRIVSRAYSGSGEWGDIETLYQGFNSLKAPRISSNKNGEFAASWLYENHNDDIKSAVKIFKNHEWGENLFVDDSVIPGLTDITDFDIGIDDKRNVFSIFLYSNTVIGGRYDACKEIWDLKVISDPSIQRSSFYPSLSVWGNGRGGVAWRQNIGSYKSNTVAHPYVSVIRNGSFEKCIDIAPLPEIVSYITSCVRKGENISVNYSAVYIDDFIVKSHIHIVNIDSLTHSFTEILSNGDISVPFLVKPSSACVGKSMGGGDMGRSWSPVMRVDNLPGTASEVKVGTDRRGNAIAAWLQEDSGQKNAYASRYNVKTKEWGNPVRLDNLSIDAGFIELSVGGEGRAVAIWTQGGNIYAAVFDESQKLWLDAELVSDGNSAARHPHVAVNEKGEAVAVWAQIQAPNSYMAFVRHLDAESQSWVGSPTVLPLQTSFEEGPGLGAAEVPRVALDPEGNAVAVWVQFIGRAGEATAVRQILASNYDKEEATWSIAQILQTPGSNEGSHPRIAMNSQGVAAVVWRQLVPGAGANTRYDVVGSFYHPKSSSRWSGALNFDANIESHAYTMDVALNESGVATTVWSEWPYEKTNSLTEVLVSRFSVEESTPLVHSLDLALGSMPRVVLNAQGEAIVVWKNRDGSSRVPYLAQGQGESWNVSKDFWGERELSLPTATAVTLPSDGPEVAASSRGVSVVVWTGKELPEEAGTTNPFRVEARILQ